jgi:hypothetical protein
MALVRPFGSRFEGGSDFNGPLGFNLGARDRSKSFFRVGKYLQVNCTRSDSRRFGCSLR